MLDLQLEADSGVYLAPLQLKANNGVFVIDDFGRQSASPEELLNRWIVPLDRGIDYLTLLGRKFEVPFDLKVVLSTNMQPAKLGDDAFFRRIHSKVFVGACSDARVRRDPQAGHRSHGNPRRGRAPRSICGTSPAPRATASCGPTCPEPCASWHAPSRPTWRMNPC